MSGARAVYFVADEKFLANAWIMAREIAREAEKNFDVLILADAQAARGVAAPAGVRLVPITLPEAMRRWPCPAHMSPFAYARLAAPDLWLRDYARALYLDSDILVRGALRPLLGMELSGALLAMAEDCGAYIRSLAQAEAFCAYRMRIGQAPQQKYFNSGVFLADLARWRARNCWARARDYIEAHGAELVFMDQEALNFLAQSEGCAEISVRWNFQTHFFGAGLEAVLAPRIFHYSDILKPWRDPEWRLLHDDAHRRAFRALFADTRWRGRVPGAGRLAWARLRGPAPALRAHLRHYEAAGPQIAARVRAGIGAALAAGRDQDGDENISARADLYIG